MEGVFVVPAGLRVTLDQFKNLGVFLTLRGSQFHWQREEKLCAWRLASAGVCGWSSSACTAYGSSSVNAPSSEHKRKI